MGRTAPDVIVMLESRGTRELEALSNPVGMDQFGREFHPSFLLVSAGQPVQFTNSENEIHSVRVISENETPKTTVYNVVIAPSASHVHLLDKPGFYDVRCDFHDEMRASIYVAPTPYAVTSDSDGRFTFLAVEPGPYTLTVLGDGQPLLRPIDVTPPTTDVSALTQQH